MTDNDLNCLPMCSLCARPPPQSSTNQQPATFKRCAKCKLRTYCNKKCQILDWKMGGHKKFCQPTSGVNAHVNSFTHQPWCAYLDRDPEIDNNCLVETGQIKTNPRELITTGMNTCIFVVIKTNTVGMIGWHASIDSGMGEARSLLLSVRKEDFVSGFIVPGEDRIEGTLDLKPTCRTMKAMPWTDPARSRRAIFNLLRECTWFDCLEILPPVNSYKDFVVFDMVHKRPYTFSNTQMFDQGCSFDGNVDSVPPMMMNMMNHF